MHRVRVSATVMVLGSVLAVAACKSDQTYVPMTAAIPVSTLDQATVLPINAAREQQERARPPVLPVPPVFPGGSESIRLAPLQTQFEAPGGGAAAPDDRTDEAGRAVFRSLDGGARLSGALVAPPCRGAGSDKFDGRGTIQYDLTAGSYSSNGDQQCSTMLNDGLQLSATYSWDSAASWSGGRLVLSGRATTITTSSALSGNDAEHLEVEEQATLRIAGSRCTVESYRLVERKRRPNSAYLSQRSRVSIEQPLAGAICRFE